MNPLTNIRNRFPALTCLAGLAAFVLVGVTHSQEADAPAKKKAGSAAAKPTAVAAGTNATAAVSNDASAAKPEAVAVEGGATPSAEEKAKSSTASAVAAKGAKGAADSDKEGSSTNDIQLSFQGANIDMIVQWLAQTTGKSVVKHPQVQCQLTITSSKKLQPRDAINLVYRALSLEGFTAVESSNSIFIVPEGKEPKMNPEILDGSKKDIPEGRQRLVKIFRLAHIQPTELREKVRGVLSEKGTIDADNQASQIVVTDYNDNLRLLAELIREFDVSDSGLVIEIYPLKHTEAEEVANLLGLIINAQATSSGGPAGRPSRPAGGGPSFPGGAMIMESPPSDSGSSANKSSTGGANAQTANPQTRIWADKNANRLIVSAPKSKLAEIQRLVEVLDTDKPEDVAVRVLPLKNIAAQDVVKEIAPLYQRMSGRTLKDMIEIAADDRTSSLIVLSSESNYKAIQKLITSLDSEDATDKIMRTFPLKNADAEDVAKQLQDLNKDQDSSSRSRFYDYYESSSRRTPPKKFSVVADRRRNSLVVQAPLSQMESLEKMIQELDEPVSDDSLAPKLYRLKFASAVDLEEVLNELFLKKTQRQMPYWYYDEMGSDPSTPERDVGRLYGKVRITSEPYSNTLIVTSNSKEALTVLEDVLKQLDQPSEAGESTLRVGLRFAKAIAVANSINILFAKNGSPPLRQVNQQGQTANQNPQPQQQKQTQTSQSDFGLEQEVKEEGYYPWLGGQPDNPRTSDGRSATRTVSDLVGRVRAVPDHRGNAVLLSANVHFFPQVIKMIEELDAPTAQVLIEARIVEVASNFMDQLGVRWSPDGSKVFTTDDYQNSMIIHASAGYLKGFGGPTTVNQPSANDSSITKALTSLRSGTLDSSVSMDFLIQFLKTTTSATVLAAPQINIEDNETGKLFVGQQVPFIDNSVIQAQGGQNNSFTYKDVGVILEVTPHINNSGDVSLKIHAESSTISGQTILNGAVIDTRNFKTDLEAKSGQTLVLGGIIQRQVGDTLRKTPLLGDIPGLGWAFKKKDKTTKEVELMVFLRPRVVRTPEEAKELMKEVDHQAPLIRDFEKVAEPKLKEKATKHASPQP